MIQRKKTTRKRTLGAVPKTIFAAKNNEEVHAYLGKRLSDVSKKEGTKLRQAIAGVSAEAGVLGNKALDNRLRMLSIKATSLYMLIKETADFIRK